MRLSEEEYTKARAELLETFGDWRADDAEHGYASLMLDYKYWYGDGNYLSWQRGDIEDFCWIGCPARSSCPLRTSATWQRAYATS